MDSKNHSHIKLNYNKRRRMTTLNKKFLPLLALLILSNCGMLHNFYLIGYDFTALRPHPYRVTSEIENSPNKKGLGIVTLDFRTDNKEYKDYDGVNTIWRKINDDGTVGKKITLTYAQLIKRGPTRVALEPGTYFIDGLRYVAEKKNSRGMESLAYVGAFTKLYSNEQKGWDFTKKQPRWFKFTVKAGQEIKIPEISIHGYCKSGSDTCDGDDFVVKMVTKGQENKQPKDYYSFGSEVVTEHRKW